MQIESLKVFCDLAETESFTRAAQINGVTQSAVSHQLALLRRARVVSARRDGRSVRYALADRHVRDLVDAARVHLEEDAPHAP